MKSSALNVISSYTLTKLVCLWIKNINFICIRYIFNFVTLQWINTLFLRKLTDLLLTSYLRVFSPYNTFPNFFSLATKSYIVYLYSIYCIIEFEYLHGQSSLTNPHLSEVKRVYNVPLISMFQLPVVWRFLFQCCIWILQEKFNQHDYKPVNYTKGEYFLQQKINCESTVTKLVN